MEFQINFGIPGLVVGFFVLGFLIRVLDRYAAVSVRQANFGNAIVGFLPALALIQPNGSLVEISSGAVAALVGAYGWRWVWKRWSARTARIHRSGPADTRRPSGPDLREAVTLATTSVGGGPVWIPFRQTLLDIPS